MIPVNDLFETVCRLVNKQAYTAYKDFNRFVAQAELQLFKERLGLPEEYQPGRPVPRVAAGMTQKVSDDLRPFLVEKPLAIDAAGTVAFPPDYARAVALRYGNKPVDVVEQSELGRRLDSKISPPTKDFPIVCYYPDRLQFYPADLGSAQWEYYRFPTTSKWAFMLDGNGRPAYDATGSVNSEFPLDCMNDLIIRICSFFGTNLKAADIAQYAEAKQRQGV